MKFSGKIVALLVVVSLLVGAAGAYGATILFGPGRSGIPMASPDKNQRDFQKIESIYQFISKNYVQKVSDEKLTNGAIQGMIGALKDPFSSYMTPSNAKQFTESLSSSFQGIGAEVQMVNGKVTVVSPVKGSPAEKAGIRPHDQILQVDDKTLEGMSLTDAVSAIKGKKGSVAHLIVKRNGVTHLLHFNIKRDEIPLQTVASKIYDKDGQHLGYIDITSFNEKTDKEFAKALQSLEGKGIDGLIVDVRGNPGGYLPTVEGIADQLIASSKPIVQIENRDGGRQLIKSKLKKKKPYPIVGLIDGGSASASEILSAALSEAGGYPLVGVKSFGKGTVQQGVTLNDKSELKLTMFKWLTPDGHWIHKKGIKPTLKVEEPAYFFTSPLGLAKGKALAYDMNNDQVADAQKMLKGVGFDPGRSDGYFDRDTETAVKAFQKVHHLPVTGQIDERTASELENKVLDAVKDPRNDLQLQAAEQMLLNGIHS